MKTRSKTIVVVGVLAVLLGALADLSARALEGPTGAGIVISIRAEASYQNDAGESFTSVSDTVTVTVATVALVAVTPKESGPSETTAPHDQITRLFRVCNSGNNADTVVVTRVEATAPAKVNALYFDNDGSATFNDGDSPISLNESASPQLSPGGCIGVLTLLIG